MAMSRTVPMLLPDKTESVGGWRDFIVGRESMRNGMSTVTLQIFEMLLIKQGHREKHPDGMVPIGTPRRLESSQTETSAKSKWSTGEFHGPLCAGTVQAKIALRRCFPKTHMSGYVLPMVCQEMIATLSLCKNMFDRGPTGSWSPAIRILRRDASIFLSYYPKTIVLMRDRPRKTVLDRNQFRHLFKKYCVGQRNIRRNRSVVPFFYDSSLNIRYIKHHLYLNTKHEMETFRLENRPLLFSE